MSPPLSQMLSCSYTRKSTATSEDVMLARVLTAGSGHRTPAVIPEFPVYHSVLQ